MLLRGFASLETATENQLTGGFAFSFLPECKLVQDYNTVMLKELFYVNAKLFFHFHEKMRLVGFAPSEVLSSILLHAPPGSRDNTLHSPE